LDKNVITICETSYDKARLEEFLFEMYKLLGWSDRTKITYLPQKKGDINIDFQIVGSYMYALIQTHSIL